MKRPIAVLAALAAVIAPTTTLAPPASAATGCRVDYSVASQWQGGFQANVKITNLGDALSGWTLGFDFTDAGQKLTQGWNATWAQSSAHVTAQSVGWNGSLTTGASTSIGFTGTVTGANPAATKFTLNGTACNGDPGGDPGTGTGALDRVSTPGRTQVGSDALKFSWPGTYFEGRFRGTGVGVVLNDPAADYEVQVDGRTARTLVTPAAGTHWVNGLTDAEHTVRLVKRNESTWATSSFGGFVAAAGGTILAKPAARTRQIEFIGDSHTAGYGNLSTSRDCTGDQVNRTTNTDQAFSALTARGLNADYQVNAFSGRGMVRNYNGGEPGTSYRTYYDRALLAVDGDVWQKPASWRPQLVVVGLGINDFSTALNPGEKWSTPEALVADYKAAYHGFLDKLRTRYGTGTTIVVIGTQGSTAFTTSAQQVVSERNSRGDDRVRYWYQDNSGLDLLGCHWHPSLHDHQLIAQRLGSFISTLPLTW
ncbi:cellulose binding domain-containing protein [Actinosynnema sp. NPDC023658]|uniref:cellulose binding domain-containing protein n=1 Tax=Actinosynnema sp. NPDC023658 TaxID=3155465 RepID=UPI0033D94E2A